VSGYGSVARYYDAEYDGFRQDVDFVLERLRAERVRGPLLEPGCGTGRMAAPLAAAGYRVCGFDLAEAMLRRARRRRDGLPPEARLRLRFSRQDMADFRYRQRFGAVVLAFSTLNLLPDAADRRRCLQRIADHLEPGGLLLADLPNLEAPGAAGPRRHRTSFRLPGSGHLVTKTVEERDERGGSAVAVRYTYSARRWLDDALVDELEVDFSLARIGRREIEGMLTEVGLDPESIWGDYLGRPFAARSARMILEARRPR
jgi:SAM-dependent methyltransferase